MDPPRTPNHHRHAQQSPPTGPTRPNLPTRPQAPPTGGPSPSTGEVLDSPPEPGQSGPPHSCLAPAVLQTAGQATGDLDILGFAARLDNARLLCLTLRRLRSRMWSWAERGLTFRRTRSPSSAGPIMSVGLPCSARSSATICTDPIHVSSHVRIVSRDMQKQNSENGDMIRYVCAKCKATLDSPNTAAGTPDTCPVCGFSNMVPGDRRAPRPFRHLRAKMRVLRRAGTVVLTAVAIVAWGTGTVSMWLSSSSHWVTACFSLGTLVLVGGIPHYLAARNNVHTLTRRRRWKDVDEEAERLAGLRRDIERQRLVEAEQLASLRWGVERQRQEIDHIVAARTREATESERSRLEQRVKSTSETLAAFLEEKRAFTTLVGEKCSGFPWLARAWAERGLLKNDGDAHWLARKKMPGVKASQRVREIAAKQREAEERWHTSRYVIDYWLAIFPFLEDFLGEVDEDVLLQILGRTDTTPVREEADLGIDPVRVLLSGLPKEEYERLSRSERNELALQRWLARPKSKWEIGRSYERYVGYMHEKEGYAVTYHGIVKGVEDLGRDLIARRGKKTLVIQCKYWSQRKRIHEKHVNQLFGTATVYEIEHPREQVTGVFYATNGLSPMARLFADRLGIVVKENFPHSEDYPVIKCNVSMATGEWIYHLPFDQQYDSTVIDPRRGERYVKTVAEAECLGFRRAFRWRGG